MAALTIERDGVVLRVTIAKPERRNAFDAALIAELTEAFADVGDARAVVLAGEGSSFCAGADVEWQRSSIDLTYEENVEDARRLYRMLEAAADLDSAVERVLGDVLAGGPQAVREAKRLVLEPVDELDAVNRAAKRRTSEEGQEGLLAFLEHREPVWRSGSSS